MQALAEEWKRRDREREALVKKKVQGSQYSDTHNAYTLHNILLDLLYIQRNETLESELNEEQKVFK